MGERGSEAAGGGRPLEERRTGVRTRRARMRRMPAPARAQQVQGRTSTLGIAHHLKDYGRTGQGPPGWRRRTWLDGAPARRDMTRRIRQWGRTRRGLTPDIQICRSQGIQTPSNGV